MSKLTSNQISKNTSKTNLSNITTKQKKKSKTINYQEINSLKKLITSELREAKGQELVNTYIKLLERQYESVIENSINTGELLKANKNNQIFQKVLKKSKDKINQRNLSKLKKDSLSNKSISFNKTSTSKSSINVSPIKKNKKNLDNNKKEKGKENEINNKKDIYWQDYDFVKYDHTRNKKNNKNKINSSSSSSNIKNKSNTKTKTEEYNKKKQLENYYLYLLNRRQKICENKETNEDKQNEKTELEIMKKILEEIYNDDEKLKQKLENNTLPEFYKRFIIQNEIKKDNLFFQNFKLNYNESQKLKGPQLSKNSRLICKYVINYEPIYDRVDKIILNKKNNIDLIKKRIERKKYLNKNSKKKSNFNDTKEWLKSMDDWYNKKMKKIKEKKDEIEKNDPSKKECKFKPYINDNAHIKKEDENLTCSDRLYLEYFTLRDKKNTMRQKQNENFSFQPNVVSHRKSNSNYEI